MSERDEQIAFFSYIKVLQNQHPELEEDLHWIHASMNGAWFKSQKMALVALEEGLTPGILDIFWPKPKKKCPGLWIEMKFGANMMTNNQKKCHDWLIQQGYEVHVCYSWTTAIMAVCKYAGLPAPDFQ
jgi:hypothetical protein